MGRKAKLTQRVADAAKPAPAGTGFIIIRDTELRGFGLRVTESGAKAWILEARIRGRNRRSTLGRWPEMSAEKARQKAIAFRNEINDGGNPADKRIAARSQVTLGELKKAFADRHAAARRRSWPEDERRFERQFGDWATWQIADVTDEAIALRHAEIGARNGKVEANRGLELLRAMFARGVKWKLVTENPASQVERFPEFARKRTLSGSELTRVVEEIEREPDVYWSVYFRLLLLLGCRRSELLAAEWRHVRLDVDNGELIGGMIRFPAEATKSGDVDEKEFGPDAAALLAALPSRGASQWVFPASSKSGHREEPKTAWARIRDRAGVPDVRIHDIRRTFAKLLGGMGYSLHLLSRALGHASLQSTAPYARLDAEPVRLARLALEQHLRTYAAKVAELPAADVDDAEDEEEGDDDGE